MAKQAVAERPAVRRAEQQEDFDVRLRVEEFAELAAVEARLSAKLEPVTKRLREVRGELEALVNEAHGAAETVVLAGVTKDAEFGPRAKKVTAVLKAKIRKMLGDKTYFELANLKIEDIRKYLTPPQVAQVLTEDQSGARRVKLLDKAPQ